MMTQFLIFCCVPLREDIKKMQVFEMKIVCFVVSCYICK